MIEDILINNFDTKIKQYFGTGDWKGNYKKSLSAINHDEPWLTLIACYSVLGNQSDYNKNNLDAINEILNSSGIKKNFNFTEITRVRVEEKLPEIIAYRNYLKQILTADNFHLYPDVRLKIDAKTLKDNASFEGNTNLDLLIEGVSNGKKTILFIEAKFLSDISYAITYNPVRDQIIRNIDCGIDYVEKHNLDIENFYFFLLTPKVFRTKVFGGSENSNLNNFGADSSRLYCFKMDEYTNAENLKDNLPHRNENLTQKQWEQLSNNIGWITFEDFINSSNKHKTIEDSNEEGLTNKFFEERNLI